MSLCMCASVIMIQNTHIDVLHIHIEHSCQLVVYSVNLHVRIAIDMVSLSLRQVIVSPGHLVSLVIYWFSVTLSAMLNLSCDRGFRMTLCGVIFCLLSLLAASSIHHAKVYFVIDYTQPL
jgi:hypothetical protein